MNKTTHDPSCAVLSSAASQAGTQALPRPASRMGKRLAGPRLRLAQQGTLHNALAWLGTCAVIMVAVWAFTLWKLSTEKTAILKEASKDAFFLSQSYSAQLDRTIGQIDQMLRQIQYVWIKTTGAIQLATQHKEGILPLPAGSRAWIVDHTGRIVSSSYSLDIGISAADQEYFRHFLHGDSQGLYISEPVTDSQHQETIVHFARKIISLDGHFIGIAVIGVYPDYLESFTSEGGLGQNDSITVKTLNGTVIASRRGEIVKSLPTIYRVPSIFQNRTGVERLSADRFLDGVPRLVAWHRLRDYPLVAVVNRSETDALAAFTVMARDYTSLTVAGNMVLLAFALVGLSFSNRLSRKRQQEEAIKNTYRLATEAAREGFFTVKALYSIDNEIEDFVIEDCNDRGASFIGITRAQAIGAKFSQLYSAHSVPQVFSAFAKAMEKGYYEDELKTSARDKSHPTWINRRIVKSGDGLAVTLRDISEAKAHQMELTKLANTDALTGLPNRHWMMGYLPVALEQAKKNHAALAILFIDLDDFKLVNDTQGHAAGDELLKAVAARIRAVLRSHDNAVRVGGDEFIVIAEGYETEANVAPLAERIIASLDAPFVLKDGNAHSVGASVGFSIFQEDGLDAESLLKHADIAMYAAKSEGKNRYKRYVAHLGERLMTRLDNGKALRRAIELDEFILHFQPRVAARNGEINSMEALMRWYHPSRGLVSPGEFIPFAEENGFIVGLGTLVIEKACRQLAEWMHAGLSVVPVSINVSAQQLNHGDLRQILQTNLYSYGVKPCLLEIEITESSVLIDHRFVLEEIAAIKAMGVKISIDDFGTGYSSMSQLQRLDLDVIKIDQSFTRALSKGNEGETFFRAMISMAHALGMEVVAEGVETYEEMVTLQALSCDAFQGYYISRPVMAAHIPAMLRKRFLYPYEPVMQ